MGFDLIGLAENDVDATAVGFPAWDTSREMLVGVGNALVVLFLIFVLFGIGGWVAALPEGFNKIVALFVVGELLKSGALFVGDDPDDVLFQPLFVGLAQFLFERTLIFLSLFLIGRTFEGIDRVGGLSLRWAGRVFRWLIGGLRVGLVLGDGAGNQQTYRYEQNSQQRLVRSNPEHERDSCQTTVVCLF